MSELDQSELATVIGGILDYYLGISRCDSATIEGTAGGAMGAGGFTAADRASALRRGRPAPPRTFVAAATLFGGLTVGGLFRATLPACK
jgi:hypothetical protein